MLPMLRLKVVAMTPHIPVVTHDDDDDDDDDELLILSSYHMLS